MKQRDARNAKERRLIRTQKSLILKFPRELLTTKRLFSLEKEMRFLTLKQEMLL